MKKFILLLTPLLAFSFLASCNNGGDIPKTEFTITWVDYNDTVLSTKIVKKGEMPKYDKEDPTRPEDTDNGIRYTFNGWSPEIVEASKDTTYKATYYESYKITFNAGEGQFSDGEKTKTVWTKKSDTPKCDETPTKTEADGIRYAFQEWSPILSPASKKTEYTAVYGESEYLITFKAGEGQFSDGKKTKTVWVKKGDTPKCDEIPTKSADNEIRYTFKEWSPSISPISKKVEYAAIYKESEYLVKFNAGDGSFKDGTKELSCWTYAGEKPECSETPTIDSMTGYGFVGWNREIVEASEPTTYIATYGIQSADYHLKMTYKYGSGNLAKVGFKYEGTITSVNWGDGNTNTSASHTYSESSDPYYIEIKGNFKKFTLHNGFGYGLVQPGNARITSVEFVECGKNGCVRLDDYVFFECTSLETVVLPSTLRWYGINPFGRCESLKSLTIDEKNEVLCDGGANAIVNEVSGILTLGTVASTNIGFTSGIKSIGSYAFDGIDKFFVLTVYDEDFDTIRTNAFYNCNNFVIVLANHIDNMENNIIHRSSVAKNISVVLGESEEEAKSYPEKAFSGASSITYDCVGYNLENDVLYARCKNNDAKVITGNHNKLKELTILSTVEGATEADQFPVVEICDNAFNSFEINKINFPSDCHITTLGSNAFAYCPLSSNITIPNSVTTIKSNCFKVGYNGPESHIEFYVPSSVTMIEKNGFYFDETLDTAVINCQVSEKPDGWDEKWWDLVTDAPTHCDVTVNWDQTPPTF